MQSIQFTVQVQVTLELDDEQAKTITLNELEGLAEDAYHNYGRIGHNDAWVSFDVESVDTLDFEHCDDGIRCVDEDGNPQTQQDWRDLNEFVCDNGACTWRSNAEETTDRPDACPLCGSDDIYQAFEIEK